MWIPHFDADGNFIQAEWQHQEEVTYDHSGYCPYCGGEVRTIGGNYDEDTMYEECQDCGWRSDPEWN